jgi:hypothetical protein
MPRAKPRFLSNHLEVVEFTTGNTAPVPNESSKPKVMYSCHKEPVWLVSKRLSPVKEPIRKQTFLGPYRSRAQPPKIANTQQHNMYMEKMLDVAPRVRANSFSRDLKKTPKE